MLKRNSSGVDAGRLAVRYSRSKSTPARAVRRTRGQRDEWEHGGEAQTIGPKVGEEVGRHEDGAFLGVVVGGEELASIGIDVRPHLVEVGDPEQNAELGVVDGASDHQWDQARPENGEEPSTVLSPAQPEQEPDRDETGADHTGPPGG